MEGLRRGSVSLAYPLLIRLKLNLRRKGTIIKKPPPILPLKSATNTDFSANLQKCKTTLSTFLGKCQRI